MRAIDCRSSLGRGRDFDLVENSFLQRPHLPEADQFQKSQKRHHHFYARCDRTEQIGKTQRLTGSDPSQDKVNFLRDAEAFAKNLLHILPSFDPLDHGLKGINQLENSNLAQSKRFICRTPGCLARENPLLLKFTLMQFRGCVLEFFVFDQLSDQIPARVVFIGVFFRWLLVGGQQAAAFQVNKVCRHDDEFARDLDVQFLESLEIFEVLAGNAFQRDVVNVDLIALGQIKQQIERALENFEPDFVIALHESLSDCRSWQRLRELAGEFSVHPNAVHDPEPEHDHQNEGAAVTNERQRHACDRQKRDGHADFMKNVVKNEM